MSIRRWLYAATFLLLSASAGLGADAYLTYRSLQRPDASFRVVPKPGPEQRGVRKASRAPKDYSVISRRNLFTSTPLRVRPPRSIRRRPPRRSIVKRRTKRIVKKKVIAKVKHRLVGTTVMPGGGFAIFEDPSTRRHIIHKKGERVGGALIRVIRRGEVHLKVGNRTQILRSFEERKSKGRASRSSRRRSTPRARRASTRTASRRSALPRSVRVLRKIQVERIVQEEGSFDGHFRAEAYQSRSGDAGVRLFPLKRRGIMRLMGLRAGDIVLSMNETPTRDASEFASALGGLQESGSAKVTLIRSGRKMSFQYRIQ